MAALDLEAELRKPARTVREPPRWFRGSLRQAFLLALRARPQRQEAAWKLFVLTPRMLLGPTEEHGEAGKTIFFERLSRFSAESGHSSSPRPRRPGEQGAASPGSSTKRSSDNAGARKPKDG